MKILKKIGLLIVLFALITPNVSVMAQDSILVPATALVFNFKVGQIPVVGEERLVPITMAAADWISDSTTFHFNCQVNLTYSTSTTLNKPGNNTYRTFTEESHKRSFRLVGPTYPMVIAKKTGSSKKGQTTTTNLILKFTDQNGDTLHLEFIPQEVLKQVELDEKVVKDQFFMLKYDSQKNECVDPITGDVYIVACDGKTQKGYIPIFVTVYKTVPDPNPE